MASRGAVATARCEREPANGQDTWKRPAAPRSLQRRWRDQRPMGQHRVLTTGAAISPCALTARVTPAAPARHRDRDRPVRAAGRRQQLAAPRASRPDQRTGSEAAGAGRGHGWTRSCQCKHRRRTVRGPGGSEKEGRETRAGDAGPLTGDKGPTGIRAAGKESRPNWARGWRGG